MINLKLIIIPFKIFQITKSLIYYKVTFSSYLFIIINLIKFHLVNFIKNIIL